jgi:peptidoglycan/xylan/chitin deacetylase (PgdA/CDA1 family)
MRLKYSHGFRMLNYAMVGIMFHHFHNGVDHLPSQGSLSAKGLDALLSRLKQTYTLLSANVWLKKALNGQLNDHDICLTLDDALACQWAVALPVFQAHNLTAFWFINTGVLDGQGDTLEIYRHFRHTAFPTMEAFYTDMKAAAMAFLDHDPWVNFQAAQYLTEYPFYTEGDKRFRYLRDDVLTPAQYHTLMTELMAATHYNPDNQALWLTANQVQQLHQHGHVIGLHSHTHPTALDRLPLDQQQAEYTENARILTHLLGEAPITMAHPCDRYNQDTLTVLNGMGIQLGFCAHRSQRPSMLEWPRVDHTAWASRSV